MKLTTCIIVKDAKKPVAAGPGEAVVSFAEVKRWFRSGSILKRLFRYRRVRMRFWDERLVLHPFALAVMMRLLSHGSCAFVGDEGGTRKVTVLGTIGMLLRLIAEYLGKRRMLGRVRARVEEIERDAGEGCPPLDLGRPAVHMRTDLSFGVVSGGSVGHIAGVLNNLDRFAAGAVFLTTDCVPTVRDDIETRLIRPENRYWDFRELQTLAFSGRFTSEARDAMTGRKPAFIYQRYSLNNLSGLELAREWGVPFVLEYNGSEIWMARHWNKPLKHEALAERIELLNLNGADVVVVVSRPMKDELVARGVDADTILVNPNGVDADKYSPETDGAGVREKYGLGGKTVIGFIGTFGPWHGAEVLADAFGMLLKREPGLRERLRLLLIGDGIKMAEVKANVEKHDIEAETVLTGVVPQAEGPAHLAACDILASPHVPNPDGTPFFGSPTKLFEYMAMGKAIVASDLDQIGEILEHNVTAWMVEPGKADALADGLRAVIDEPDLRRRLGAEARREAVEKFTWLQHTRRIVEKLRERCGGD